MRTSFRSGHPSTMPDNQGEEVETVPREGSTTEDAACICTTSSVHDAVHASRRFDRPKWTERPSDVAKERRLAWTGCIRMGQSR